MKRPLVGLLFVPAMLASAPGTARPQDPPPIFDKRPYAEAKAAAEKDKKWFIAKATAEWCSPCKMMDRTTWRDEKVVRWLDANAVAVAFDVDKEKQLAGELDIEAMPTMIAFRDGKEFDRIVGYKDPAAFLVWLEGIARGEKSIERVKKRAAAPAEGGKVNVRARYDLARALARDRRFDEAVEEFVWLWEHMLEHDRATSGVRLSSMVNDMQRLAQRSDAARARFIALRDKTGKLLEGDKVDGSALRDWVALNKVVGDPDATLAWYDRVKDEPRWRPLVERVSRDLTELLTAKKRWADVGRIQHDPLGDLDNLIAFLAILKKQELLVGDAKFEDIPGQMARDHARVVYAGLLASGRDGDAVKLADKARAYDASTRMLAALISTALEAGQPRAAQLEWLDRAPGDKADPELAELRARLKQALDKSP
jgi:thioredoxin 1